MKKDLMIIAGAALAVWLMLRSKDAAANSAPKYWVTAQGNTAYPDELKTGGVWL